MRLPVHLLGLLASAALISFGAAAPAEAAPAHIRGSISAVDGKAVSITADDGTHYGLTLGDDWKIGAVRAATMDDIKPGTFIGTANAVGPDGAKALEVVVFPDALRGTGEGDRPWDLKPGSAMTNATISSAVESTDGRTVTLSYKGGEKKVTIAPSTPIVQVMTDATAADVKPGAKVFIAVADGATTGTTLEKGTIVVGRDGIKPPM